MKRIFRIFYLLVVLAILPFTAKSQYNVAKIDMFGLSSNLYVARLGYERSLNKSVSVGLGIERGKYSSRSTGSISGPLREIYKVTGWGLTPEVRIYPFNAYKPAPVGFFIGSHFKYRMLKETSDQSGTFKGNAYSVGINAGYKVRISQFIIDIVLGYGPSGGGWNEEKGDYSFTNFEDKFRIEINLGFLFPKIPPKDKSGKYLYL